MKKHLQFSVLLLLLGGLGGTGCGDSSEALPNTPTADIPESEYELFASMVRNIDAAEKDLELARQTGNRVTIGRVQAMLDERRNQLDTIFVQKYGSEAVEGWRATVRGADTTMAQLKEQEMRGAELLAKFKAVGATGRLDANGFIIELKCKNIALPKVLVTRISNCRNLKKLTLSGAQFEDSQFQHLTGLTQLTHLDLSDNALNGEHLSKLSALTMLEVLDLSGTVIGDARVPQFEALSQGVNKIRNIDISNTRISLTGYEKITKAFKQATVKEP